MTKEEEENISSLILKAIMLNTIQEQYWQYWQRAKKIAEEGQNSDYCWSYNANKNISHQVYLQAKQDYIDVVYNYKMAIGDLYNKEVEEIRKLR